MDGGGGEEGGEVVEDAAGVFEAPVVGGALEEGFFAGGGVDEFEDGVEFEAVFVGVDVGVGEGVALVEEALVVGLFIGIGFGVGARCGGGFWSEVVAVAEELGCVEGGGDVFDGDGEVDDRATGLASGVVTVDFAILGDGAVEVGGSAPGCREAVVVDYDAFVCEVSRDGDLVFDGLEVVDVHSVKRA